jgi:hypothetical protein
MPNWCYNYMTVKGTKRELAKFVNDITVADVKVEGDKSRVVVEYDLNKLVPLDPRGSKEVKTTNADGTETVFTAFSTESDGFDGYLDACETWGSKWGACRPEIDDTTPVKNTISVRYESAWSPCDGLIAKISAMYPSLIFGVVSTEESSAFVAWSAFHNGQVIEEGGRDPQILTPELDEKCKKANDPENPNLSEDEEDWYESFSEWEHHLVELCDDELMIVMTEYTKHLAYVRRCDKEGRTPRTFISSV